jgi:hypothetical protein
VHHQANALVAKTGTVAVAVIITVAMIISGVRLFASGSPRATRPLV